MMGRAHALSGIALYAVGAPAVASVTGLFELTPATWALGALMCGGAALVPDLDHPGSSSASNSLPPVTGWLAQVVSLVSGGHRKGTHSILGIVAFTALTVLTVNAFAPWGPLLVAFLLTAFTTKALKLFNLIPGSLARGLGTAIVAAVGTLAVWRFGGDEYSWLVAAVALGVFWHIVGDAITVMGVPLLWPLSQWDFRLARLKAGGPTELFILTPVFCLAIAWAAYQGIHTGDVLGYPVTTHAHSTASVSAPATAHPTPAPAPTRKPARKPKS
ncbi:MAG: hypothetical protein QG661_2531 [Actinomycetota bacterium]|jgi:membrane-bound metal-dependent hydrolase YbcI (DUF457 family)|nr:hypothetical protein [Actinomycetota bacterium]